MVRLEGRTERLGVILTTGPFEDGSDGLKRSRTMLVRLASSFNRSRPVTDPSHLAIYEVRDEPSATKPAEVVVIAQTPKRRFRVEIAVTKNYTVEVEAETEDDAIDLAGPLQGNSPWIFYDGEDADGIQVHAVEIDPAHVSRTVSAGARS